MHARLLGIIMAGHEESEAACAAQCIGLRAVRAAACHAVKRGTARQLAGKAVNIKAASTPDCM